MKEALLGISASKFNIVLTFVGFVLISLEQCTVPQPTQAVPFNSDQNCSSALAVRLSCCGLSLTSLALRESKGKCHRKMALLAYGSVHTRVFLPLSTILRDMNVFLHLSSEMTKQEMERLRGNAQVPVPPKNADVMQELLLMI